MSKRLTKKQILTIPNAMSLFRIILIPLMIWLYVGKGMYISVAVLIVISALTDVLDGRVARHFHVVSDVGKVLDPIADKLTQGCLILCLIRRFPWFLWLLLLFALREVVVVILGGVVLKKTDQMRGAMWYGKAATVLIYLCMFLLILFPGIGDTGAAVMSFGCALMIVISAALYSVYYIRVLLSGRKKAEVAEDKSYGDTVLIGVV